MNRRIVIALAALAAVVAVAALLWTFHNVVAASPKRSPSAPAAPIPAEISYQGQLTDPNTGNPVADGVYSMTFRIYDGPAGGASLLWSWSGALTVTNGLFNVRLPVNPQHFNGQGRWLGVQVGTDPEMQPRQALLPVPYALSLWPGGLVGGTSPDAIYTFVNSGSGLALAADGDVHIDGDLSWYTRTSKISISPAAFQPYDDSYSFVRKGRSLYTTSGEHYYAPVQLPDGATVEYLNFCYRDDVATTGAVTVTLRRAWASASNDDYEIMAEVGSDSVGYQCNVDMTVDNPVVDNASYIYWLHAHFDGTLDEYRQVRGVIIRYAYTEPY